MATKKFRKERAPKMLRYFFWDSKLHRTLLIDLPRNILHAWCYEDEKKVQFVYSHIRVHRERAWRTSEVCKLVNRSRTTIFRMVRGGEINKPVKSYSMDGDEKYPGIGFWTAKDIYALHEALLEPGANRAQSAIPSRMALTAKMEDGVSYVLMDDAGNKTRVFKETLW